MDVHVGDLHSTIVDRELEIIQELLEEVLKYDEAISVACDVCAELDCLLSFSEASRIYNFTRPEMTEENVIDIAQGRCVAHVFWHFKYLGWGASRHPLIEQVVDTFVPNDARLLGGAGIGATVDPPDRMRRWNSMLLCTGANACGKVGLHTCHVYLTESFTQSVYLKQVCFWWGSGGGTEWTDSLFSDCHYSDYGAGESFLSPQDAIAEWFMQDRLAGTSKSVMLHDASWWCSSFVPAESATLGIVDKSWTFLHQ